MSANKSISNAEGYLIAIDQYNSNYSSDVLNETNDRISLSRNQSNATDIALLAQAQSNQNASFAGMKKNLALELAALNPLIGSVAPNYNSTAEMIAQAQGSYTNATNSYEKQVIGAISKVMPFSSYSYQQITVIQSTYWPVKEHVQRLVCLAEYYF